MKQAIQRLYKTAQACRQGLVRNVARAFGTLPPSGRKMYPGGDCPYLNQTTLGITHVDAHEGTAEDRDSVLRCAALQIQRTLRNTTVGIFSRSPLDYTYRLAAQAGLAGNTSITFERDSVVLSKLDEMLDSPLAGLPPCERSKLEATGGVLLVPLRLQGELIGFVNLGRKISGGVFTPRDKIEAATMAGQLALALDHLRLRRQQCEYECAREIQEGLLPREIPQLPNFEIATAWQPARTVSGDCFDVLHLGATSLAVYVADVAGKGVPAALLTATLQGVVRAFTATGVSPAELCAKVNRVIAGNIASNRFISFFYGVLDAVAQTVTYTNAGHNPPLLVHQNGTVERLETGGPVLGVLPEAGFEQAAARLRCGDRLLVYTDGISEAGISLGEEFGEERLARIALDNPRAGARALRSAIMDAVRRFAPGEPEDDITLLVAMARDRHTCAECPHRKLQPIRLEPPGSTS